MTRKHDEYIVTRTGRDGTKQYVCPPGVWREQSEHAQKWPKNEAQWLAFTNSTRQQPAKAELAELPLNE